MKDRLFFYWNRIRERLWFKPLVVSLLSVAAAFAARSVDGLGLADKVPEVDPETNETLLSIMASSMLVIATFAVASMVSAYASAGTTATPRSFPLIVADDVSQNALSSFIGAFIYSIVALVAIKDGYYGDAGQFVLFVLTMLVFAWVVLTFVRWVDKIARLGRLGNIVDKVESAAAASLERRRRRPTLGGRALDAEPKGQPLFASRVGYVQRVDVGKLQELAEQADCRVAVTALPGTFATPARPVLYLDGGEDPDGDFLDALRIGNERVFDDDPRFGLIVLSEIAARALSPAVNDPGTAINIIGTFVRLFEHWVEPLEDPGDADVSPACDRVSVPRISIADMFDDAFTSIARDGAGMVEVQVRLQKAFRALAAIENDALEAAATEHSRMALERAKHGLALEDDIEVLRRLALTAESH